MQNLNDFSALATGIEEALAGKKASEACSALAFVMAEILVCCCQDRSSALTVLAKLNAQIVSFMDDAERQGLTSWDEELPN